MRIDEEATWVARRVRSRRRDEMRNRYVSTILEIDADDDQILNHPGLTVYTVSEKKHSSHIVTRTGYKQQPGLCRRYPYRALRRGHEGEEFPVAPPSVRKQYPSKSRIPGYESRRGGPLE
jgi:hypothetical protein